MAKQLFIFLMLFIAFSSLNAQDTLHQQMINILKDHGMGEKSEVMEIASWITDVHGPRLTGSPGLERALVWAEETLNSWGMSNVHREAWAPFDRGWELQHFEMHAHSPQYWTVLAYPKAWSPSTKGTVSGEVVYLKVNDESDLENYRGKLKGKFVLMDTIRDVSEWMDPPASRYDSEDLLEMANATMPTPRPRNRNYNLSRFTLNRAIWKMLNEEKPHAVLDRSYKGDLGTIFVSGAVASGEESFRPYEKDAAVIPQATVSVEHYNRMLRLLSKNVPVKISMEIKARYTPVKEQYNLIAEIPGSDLADEVVIFGAHFDSWHTATGATDNGAGSAVMMETARLLLKGIEESGIKPRRTLRLALWTGEEQGLFGSRHYVKEHFDDTKPETLQKNKKVAAYYNLDNGTGKIRGVYLQGNEGAGTVFRQWLSAFSDLDANTLTLRNTGGTDHLPFDGVNIPGFQFIQDPIAYFNRTHHSNMDNWDHLIEEDLQQAATIIASFVWHTSQRDEILPRKPRRSEQ